MNFSSKYNENMIMRILSIILVLTLCLVSFSVFVLAVDDDSTSDSTDEFYKLGIQLVRPASKYIVNDTGSPEFLSLEDVYFATCIDEDVPVKTSAICLDSNNFEEVEAFRWSGEKNCYISSINLDGFECQHLRLQAEYEVEEENFRIYEDYKINKFSKTIDSIVNSQYSDGGWKTTRDTAYGIFALSFFEDSFENELEKAVDWLKEERNEELKCWPKSPCDIPLTMEILYLLKESGYDDAKRVVRDAKNWIEGRQSFFEPGDRWTVSVKSRFNGTIVALVAYNDEVLDENFTFDQGDSKTYAFNSYINGTVYVISYENFEAVIRDEIGREMFRYEGNNMSYVLPGACWSQVKLGEPCNSETTAFAAPLDLEERNKIEAKRWMFSQVNHSEHVGVYYGDENSTLETALFISVMENDSVANDVGDYEDYMTRFDYKSNAADRFNKYIEEAIDWLLFNQNNEGSWNIHNSSIESKAVYTAYSVMALFDSGYNRTFEPIEDAEYWASSIEQNLSLNDTRSLASAFYVLRNNARPLVVSEPKVLQVRGSEMTFQLFNPTTFNLKDVAYNLSGDLGDYLSIDTKKEISSYSYRKIEITKKENPAEDLYGFLTVFSADDPIAKIPIVITDSPLLNVSIQDDVVNVFGKSGYLNLGFAKSDHEFVCTMEWDNPEIITPGSFKVTGDKLRVPFTFSIPETKDSIYTGIFRCKARGEDFPIPMSVYISRYATNPISVEPLDFMINGTGQHMSFIIKNNLDLPLNPQINLDGARPGLFSAPGTVSLLPGESKNVTVMNLIGSDDNVTTSFTINVEASGHREQISVFADVMAEVEAGFNFIVLAVWVLVLGILGGLGFAGYKFKDDIQKLFGKFDKVKMQNELDENIESLHQLKATEKETAISNIISILRLQGKTDEDIKAEVLKLYSEAEVRAAIEKGVIQLGGFE